MTRLVIFGAGGHRPLAHFYFRTHVHTRWPRSVLWSIRNSELATPSTGCRWSRHRRPRAPVPARHACAVRGHQLSADEPCRADKYRQMKEGAATRWPAISARNSHATLVGNKAPGDKCRILEDNTYPAVCHHRQRRHAWSGNHIGHDSTIEDHCFISSHVVVSGHVRVRSYCFIGVNATLRNGIEMRPRRSSARRGGP